MKRAKTQNKEDSKITNDESGIRNDTERAKTQKQRF